MKPAPLLLVVAAACGAAQRPPSQRLVVDGRALVAPSPCTGERPAVSGAAARATGEEVATAAERAHIAEQLVRTDPTSAGQELSVRRVVRADLDGDGREDAAFAVATGGLDAVVLVASSSPFRLRILQFADGEPYDLLATVDVEPDKPGRELVLQSRQPDGVTYEVVRATGELVVRARCLTSP